MVLRVGNDAVVLLTAGIALELVQRNHLRELLRLKIDASEIAHGGCTGYVEAAADFFGGRDLFKFQIQKFCCIILIEYSVFSFVVIGGAFMIKDYTSMLNL